MLIVISDLHIGDGGPQDDWVQRPDGFDMLNAMLARVQDLTLQGHAVTVVIAGDLYNGEYGPRACIDGPTLRKVCGLLRPLRPVYCVGNHDSDTWDFKDHPIFKGFRQLVEEYQINKSLFMGGVDTLLIHGHQVDLFCGRWGWIGKLVSRAAWLIGKLKPSWEDALRGSGGSANANKPDEQRLAADAAFACRAVAYAKKRGCNRVICGHSHEEQTIGPEYCNAGLFCRDGWLEVEA